MATGSISASDPTNWILLETKTATSVVTVYDFTGLGGKYKKLMVALNSVGCNTTSSYAVVQFNGDTSTNYAGGPTNSDGSGSSNRERSKIWMTASPAYEYYINGFVQFANCDSAAPKILERGVTNYAADVSNGCWMGSATVDSLQVTVVGGGLFTNGTISLFGIPS